MMEKQNPARKETIFCAGFSLLCKLRKNTDVKLHKNELQFLRTLCTLIRTIMIL